MPQISATLKTPTVAIDLDSLNLVQRYRLMTAKHLSLLRPDRFKNTQAAATLLDTLAKETRLAKGRLFGETDFYFVPMENEHREFSETAKLRNYAMLCVCAVAGNKRMRLKREDFGKYFPDTQRHGLPMNYYVDLNHDSPILGFMRIDMGGRGRWDRIVAKAQADVRNHQCAPAMRPFLERNAIEIRIVTALPQKADRIRRAITHLGAEPRIPICISAVPELLNIIAPTPLR